MIRSVLTTRFTSLQNGAQKSQKNKKKKTTTDGRIKFSEVFEKEMCK